MKSPTLTLPPKVRLTPFAIADAYKESHPDQYPDGTTFVYSNYTPRKSRWQGMDRFVLFGTQAFLYEMNEIFWNDFFSLPEDEAVEDFSNFYLEMFGIMNVKQAERVRELHKLGYLPLHIRALPEGTAVPHGIPVLTIHNTRPEFYWLTNFVETWMSSEMWHPCTSATTAWYYRKVFSHYAELTASEENMFLVDFLGHDFSLRGMTGIKAGTKSAAGHGLSFKGSDACPVPHFVKRYYWGDNGLVVTSVPATEHSVMCAGGKESEIETFRRILKLYQTGIVSVVSDTWDFWKVVTEILVELKDEIMAREGKLVIRPDSSPKTPVEIICGDPDAEEFSPERKGLIQCLYEIFGGKVNDKGFIELDSHIGAIYGDSITLAYAQEIGRRLMEKGFAITNVVLGIGSYTYQYVTRDTHGQAIKATAVGRGWIDSWNSLNDNEKAWMEQEAQAARTQFPEQIIPIFKDPKTDRSGKKSARGLLRVSVTDGKYTLHEFETWDEWMRWEKYDAMRDVYIDGQILNHQSYADVRATLARQ